MFYVFGISFIYTFTIFLFLYSTYSLQVSYTFMFISFHVHILCMYHILSYLVYFHITYLILSCTFIYILILFIYDTFVCFNLVLFMYYTFICLLSCTFHILSSCTIYILHIHLYVLILSYTLCFRILSIIFLYWFKTNTFIPYLYFSYYVNFYLIFPISRRSIRLILLLSYHILSYVFIYVFMCF